MFSTSMAAMHFHSFIFFFLLSPFFLCLIICLLCLLGYLCVLLFSYIGLKKISCWRHTQLTQHLYTNRLLLSNSFDNSSKYLLKFFFIFFFSIIIQFKVFSLSQLLIRFENLFQKYIALLAKNAIGKFRFWLVVWVLWHINHCRLFYFKPIFIKIISSISNNSL